MDTVIVLHRWTLTMNTMTLSSTGQYWTATPGFADGYILIPEHFEAGSRDGVVLLVITRDSASSSAAFNFS